MTIDYKELKTRITELLAGDDDQIEAGEELRAKYELFQVIEELQVKIEENIEKMYGAGMVVKIAFEKSDLYRFSIALNRIRQDLKSPLGLR